MNMSKSEWDKDREVIEAATEGPWYWFTTGDKARTEVVDYLRRAYEANSEATVHGCCVPNGDHPLTEEALFTAVTGNGPTSEANAKFIVCARTRWPAALDEIERLRKEIKALKQWIGTAQMRAYRDRRDEG
jgi:hypothetical protein